LGGVNSFGCWYNSIIFDSGYGDERWNWRRWELGMVGGDNTAVVTLSVAEVSGNWEVRFMRMVALPPKA
jgi:hypothetical protein